MKVHFREKYGSGGDEILYVTPEGKKFVMSIPTMFYANSINCIYFIRSKLCRTCTVA